MNNYSMKDFVAKLFDHPMVSCHADRLKKEILDTVVYSAKGHVPANIAELGDICKAAFGCTLVQYTNKWVKKERCLKVKLLMSPGHWAFREQFSVVVERRFKKVVDAAGEVWEPGDYVRFCFERKGFSQSTGLFSVDRIKSCSEYAKNFLDGFIGSDGLTEWERNEIEQNYHKFKEWAEKRGIEITATYEARRIRP